jgi:RNA polymerase sigma factor (sigma-70 family)
MSASALVDGLRFLRGKLASQQRIEDSDEQLLRAFVSQRDENAFAVLVRRHGSMVLQVCSRVLEHEQDAEDAFQATFLVLARDADSLRKKSSLASFLHGTASRLARNAKRAAARRRKYEAKAATRPSVHPANEMLWREVRALLDEEIARLPEKYRGVFVLCLLEELSQAEAGRRLGLKERTVSHRLAEARKQLSQRLARRGLELTAVLAASTLASQTASALSPLLISTTIKAASAIVAGDGMVGPVSASVAELLEAGSAGLVSGKAKATMALLLGVTLLAGAGVWWGADPPASAPQHASSSAPRSSQKPVDSLVLQGRVLGPDNRPVADAKLYLPRWSKERRQNPRDVAIVQRGVTDKDGRFRLEMPRQEMQPDQVVPLVAVAENFGLAWVDLPQKDAPDELILRLVKDVPIRGRLLSTEGKPVAGVTVTVHGVMAFERLDDFLRAFQRERKHIDEGMGVRRLELPLHDLLHVKPTDKEGRFEIRGVGAERLAGLEVKSPAISEEVMMVVTREGFDAKSYLKGLLISKGERMPPLFGPSLEHVVERAEASRIVEGTVREAGSGKPVAGATVEVDDTSTRTDANGHYRLVGMSKPRNYWLQVSGPENVPLIGRGQIVKVSAQEGGKPMRVDVELRQGIVVTGRVYDRATGKGVLSRVHFAPLPENKTPQTGGLLLSTPTGADGRYRLVTIPGPGVLLASVAGTVMKIDGVPIYPYKPAEFDAADRPRIRMSNQLGPHRAFVTADGVEALDHQHACKILDIKEGSTAVTCDLAVDPGKTLTVQLRDPKDEPLAGAVAMLGVSPQTKRPVPLKSDTCKIYALDPQNPRLVVFLHAKRKLAAAVTLRGDEKAPVTILLAPSGIVTGRVLDAEGQPIVGAEVFASYAHPEGSYFSGFQLQDLLPRTDKEGHFRMEGIVPGLKVNLGFLKGKQRLPLPPLNIKPLQSGQTRDAGDIRIKPQRP